MWIAIAALLLAAPTDPEDWELSDTIDNITGERTVTAQALSLNDPPLRSAWLECAEGSVTLEVAALTRLPGDRITMTFSTTVQSGAAISPEPSEWSVWHGETNSYATAPAEFTRRIADASAGATEVVLAMDASGGGTTYRFRAAGLKPAYDLIARHCAAPMRSPAANAAGSPAAAGVNPAPSPPPSR